MSKSKLLIAAALCIGHVFAAEGVVLTDLGNKVKMDNGLVSVIIVKENATITSMTKDGVELLMAPSKEGVGMGYIQRQPQCGYTIPKIDRYSVFRQTPDLVDLSFTQNNNEYPFAFDVHYVMRSGVSGFYNYIVLGYDTNKTAQFVANWRPGQEKEKGIKLDAKAFSLGQCNLCLRMSPKVFTHAAVSDERQARIVTEEETKAGEMIMDAVFRLTDGRIYTKYDWAVRMDRHRLHGVMGNGLGAWIILGTGEHLNGGPHHQELTTHNAILLRHFSASHFGSTVPPLTPEDHGWSKIGGPWFVYINAGATHAQLWADAKKKAEEYLAEWPCVWLKHPLYPLARGTVRGRLSITDGTDPAGSLVILAQPPGGRIPEWQQQGLDYIFWSWVRKDGSFEIGKVRPKKYTLYILNDRLMGEFRYDGVTVTADQTMDVGTLSWVPELKGKVIWQIGAPDRTSQEFRRGDEPRQYGRWLKYATDFPDDVTFEIGKSRERTDWNYVHTASFQDGRWRIPTWQVVFDSDRTYTGRATLRIGIASASVARSDPEAWVGLELAVNRVRIGACRFSGSDGATHRGGTQGRYREQAVEFDAGLIKEGRNVLSLALASSMSLDGNIAHRPLPSPPFALQYDCLRLEINEQGGPTR